MARRGILSRSAAPRQARAGMTLIECMVALVILAGSLMALGNFMGKYSHVQSMSSFEQKALDIATLQIDSIKHAPVYANIPSSFTGSASIPVGGGVNFKRTTTIDHVGGNPSDTLDVMYVTVTVQAADSGATVKKTAVIPAF
jgi:prepilin-type N-terminal cleavage/methylation domain-containing protein